MRDYPHNLDAERCILGAMILGAAAERMAPAYFYHEKHRYIFDAIQAMQEAGVCVDAVSVRHHALKTGVRIEPLEMVRFMECAATATSHIDTHTDILIECWRRRRMIEMGDWLYRRATDFSEDV